MTDWGGGGRLWADTYPCLILALTYSFFGVLWQNSPGHGVRLMSLSFLSSLWSWMHTISLSQIL